MLQVETIDKKKSNFNRLKVEVAKVFPELNDYELEKIVERNSCTNVF